MEGLDLWSQISFQCSPKNNDNNNIFYIICICTHFSKNTPVREKEETLKLRKIILFTI